MKEVSAYDQPLYRNFVKPDLCRHLQHLGLTSGTPYQWKITSRDTALYTKEFDIDSYYVNAVKQIDAASQPIVCPAFTTADCMLCFNLVDLDYTITCEDYRYYFKVLDASMAKICLPLYGDRLPDVLALVLQNLIYSCKIDVQAANTILATKNFVQQ